MSLPDRESLPGRATGPREEGVRSPQASLFTHGPPPTLHFAFVQYHIVPWYRAGMEKSGLMIPKRTDSSNSALPPLPTGRATDPWWALFPRLPGYPTKQSSTTSGEPGSRPGGRGARGRCCAGSGQPWLCGGRGIDQFGSCFCAQEKGRWSRAKRPGSWCASARTGRVEELRDVKAARPWANGPEDGPGDVDERAAFEVFSALFGFWSIDCSPLHDRFCALLSSWSVLTSGG